MTKTVQEVLRKAREEGQLKRRTTSPALKELDLVNIAETIRNKKTKKTGE